MKTRDKKATPPPSGLPTSNAELLRTIRHDLLTPINQLIGYSEMLQEDVKHGGRPELVPGLSKIGVASRRLAELVLELGSSLGAVEEGEASDDWSPQGALTTIEAMASWRPPELDGEEPAVDEESAPSSENNSMLALLGATFRPQEPTPLSTDAVAEEEAEESQPESLLVVDDNELNRNILARHLFRRGYAVCTAEGGHEALETLEAHPFDLVLLDVVMPEMDGLSVLRKIRRTSSLAALPVIMVTARTTSEDVIQALELGANDYVTKPLDLRLVTARIRNQLALKKALDRVQSLNTQLQHAQISLTRVASSTPETIEELGVWARSLAAEVASALNVDELGVWTVDPHEKLTVIVNRSIEPPSAGEIDILARTAKPLEREVDTLIPALGRAGELQAVIAVPRRNVTHSLEFWQLLSSFARQLGGALELKALRQQLALAKANRRASRAQMADQGIELLQVCTECGRCYDQNVTECPLDGAPLDASRPLPYRIAGRYRLVELLGEGGMGTVYEAFDQRLDREVAIKVITPSQFDNDRVRHRFGREARAIARLDHPNIVAVHDCGNLESGMVYIIMERLRGRDLARMVKLCGPGKPREIAALLRQAAAALAAAHQAQIIHRDIKPENIFLIPDSRGFTVKLVDFGLAKVVSADSVLTRSGTIVGTPLFMSPEQALAEEMDFGSDIYSLAAVAFYALTGRHLTLEKAFANILFDIIKSKAPALSSVLPTVPTTVNEAFAAALSKDRTIRPTDVEAWVASFVAELEMMPPDDAPGWLTEGGHLYLTESPLPKRLVDSKPSGSAPEDQAPRG